MKNNACFIATILDRSGSMDFCKNETIEGFNSFLNDQRKIPGEAVISLYQFDDIYETVYEWQDIKNAPYLDDKTFVPRGWTALLDAMGKTINSVGERLSKMKEEDRPGKIIVCILSDGHENRSTEFNKKQIFDMVKHQQEKYNWVFVFLGANMDAIQVAGDIGIAAASAMSYSTTNTTKVYKMASDKVAMFRAAVGSSNVSFSDKEREDAMKDND